MHLDLGYEELYRVDTGSDRRHGYQFSDRQFDALARMNTLGLRDSKKIFTLADSKNIGYDAFCEKYGQYTSGWHSVRNRLSPRKIEFVLPLILNPLKTILVGRDLSSGNVCTPSVRAQTSKGHRTRCGSRNLFRKWSVPGRMCIYPQITAIRISASTSVSISLFD